MINAIISFCLRQRLLVILATLVVVGAGLWAMRNVPIDAIPDLSENQVIVFADWPGRSPQEIEDQVTYPLTVNLQGLAGVKSVRSLSDFNFSMISIIFDEHADFYFSRQRVLERLSTATTFLPAGVIPYMAADATALGQIFWYTVEGGGKSLDELRAIQDWYIRYQLNSVAGVAQVSTIGGLAREYQVDVDPEKLRAYNLSIGQVYDAVAKSNFAMGGKVYFQNGAEYLIRGLGWLEGVSDLENTVVAVRDNVPILIKQLARVQLGPEFRRNLLEKDGHEAVGGVVMMRYGENPLTVTQAVKDKIRHLQAGLPPGVSIVPFYERTQLIEGAIHTVSLTLEHEILIASLAVLLILTHLRSALLIIVTLPLSILMTFIFMKTTGMSSNIMALAGIAISIGILVDGAIVMLENASHELTLHGEKDAKGRVIGDTLPLIERACKLVGGPIFFSLLIMVISFLPVFALTGQEGKMFHPLAWTKTFAVTASALLAITLVPALLPIVLQGRLRREEDNWIVRSFIGVYRPMLEAVMQRPGLAIWLMAVLLLVGTGLVFGGWIFVGVAGLALCLGGVVFHTWGGRLIAFATLLGVALFAYHLPKLGYEFMPPLDEGHIMDMPTTVPRINIAQAADDLLARDRIIRQLPELAMMVGKLGRADTPTDPSGLDMVESVLTLRPKDQWTRRKVSFDQVLDGVRKAAELNAQTPKPAEAVASPKPTVGNRPIPDQNATAMNVLAAFDTALRQTVVDAQQQYEPVLRRQLIEGLFDQVMATLSVNQTLLLKPTGPQRHRIVDRLAADHGRKLADYPRVEELDAILLKLADLLVQEHIVVDANVVLDPAPTRWQQVTNAGQLLLSGKAPDYAERLLHQLQEQRQQLLAENTRQINWQIEDQAPCILAREILNQPGSALSPLPRREGSGAGEHPASAPASQPLQPIEQALTTYLAATLRLEHKTKNDLVQELDTLLQVPGWGNIWTQPIINRVDMLATGVRTQLGVLVFGSTLPDIQKIGQDVAAVLRKIPGAVDVFPDQIIGRSYLEIKINREKAARYGVAVADIQEAIEVAMGGKSITTTVEGRQRFPVRVRYAREARADAEALGRVLVSGSTAGGAGQLTLIPLAQVADIHVTEGPSMIKSENGLLRSYVQLNVRDRDLMGFVEEAKQRVAREVPLPPGVYLEWAGQFEHQQRFLRTLAIVFPLVLVSIFVILYLTLKNLGEVLQLMLTVPGALVGGLIFQSIYGFNFNGAVWVGYIACFGMAVETGVVMMVYLKDAIRRFGGLEAVTEPDQITQTIIAGAVHRLRPKLLTEGTAILGLVPMIWATGVGAEVIRPMAVPVLGGLLIADEVIDLVLPVIYHWMLQRRWRKLGESSPPSADSDPSETSRFG